MHCIRKRGLKWRSESHTYYETPELTVNSLYLLYTCVTSFLYREDALSRHKFKHRKQRSIIIFLYYSRINAWCSDVYRCCTFPGNAPCTSGYIIPNKNIDEASEQYTPAYFCFVSVWSIPIVCRWIVLFIPYITGHTVHRNHCVFILLTQVNPLPYTHVTVFLSDMFDFTKGTPKGTTFCFYFFIWIINLYTLTGPFLYVYVLRRIQLRNSNTNRDITCINSHDT